MCDELIQESCLASRLRTLVQEGAGAEGVLCGVGVGEGKKIKEAGYLC